MRIRTEEDEKDTGTVVRMGAGLDPGTAGASCTCTFKSIEDLQPGDHLCCLYDTEEEHRELMTLYLKTGLEKCEKVIYIVDARTAETVLGYLRDAGVEVEPYLSSGQLAILSVDEAYMASGEFDPDGMIGMLTDETEKALAEGYGALRVTGEMSWALKGLPGSERLMEYEAKLNRFFPGSKCLSICQYDRRMFEPSVLLNVLSTHPFAVLGTELFDNFYYDYVPPDEFFAGEPQRATLDHWVSSLRERKEAEESLRASEEKYRTLFENMLEGFAFCRMVYDDDGHPVDWFYLDANKAFEPLTGLENVVGRYATEIMPGINETNPELLETYGRVASTGKPEQLEVRVVPLSRDLSIKVFSPVKDCFAAVFENITERKRAEEEIRRLGHRLMEEGESVRASIAADLHDDVGQSLSAIKMALDIQRKKMAGHAHDETGERMANIRDMLSETIDKVRNITVGLAPVELTDLGLDSALQSYLEDFARDTGATCAFKTEGARVQGGVEVKTALFRIAQEALANIRKHSKASNVEVSVSWSESFVSLSVRDDGAGFDVDRTYAASRAGDHFGLVAMRERARMLKGDFIVESRLGEGTTVTVSVPLECG
jgi:signal transduction histidine kinase